MSKAGDVLFVSRSRRMSFSDPVDIICARSIGKVKSCLDRVSEGVGRGLHAAGFLAYESAGAFSEDLATHSPAEDVPLLWFGLYVDRRIDIGPAKLASGPLHAGPWRRLIADDEYIEGVRSIKEWILAGDTYQANYTFQCEAAFEGDTLAWFERLYAAQQADYCAWINGGRYHILSVSPELFFRLDGERLTTRPMKGTKPRGLWAGHDRQMAAELAASEKDRAENLMIVDLLRNDVGRVSEAGSVHVPALFEIERFPTVWQMTSTVASRTRADVPQILQALFPCGSVTGAPKIRTMQVIRELEPMPRGVYCGAIGWWSPGRKAEFSVAIRTITADTERGLARIGTGSAITADSTPGQELDECRTKMQFTVRNEPEFELLETIRYDGEFYLLEEHLDRICASAEYFGFPFSREAAKSALERGVAQYSKDISPEAGELSVIRARLLLSREGAFRTELQAVPMRTCARLGFAVRPVDTSDVFLYHKTTCRGIYEEARAQRPGCGDVLLWNSRGEITESSVANAVFSFGGKWITPPVECGLLPGTFRRHLLETGEIQEGRVTREEAASADAICLINSVQKWIRATLEPVDGARWEIPLAS